MFGEAYVRYGVGLFQLGTRWKVKVKVKQSDLISGLLLAGVGIVYGAMTLKTLTIGDAVAMGPGYFPIVLSGLLVLVGLINIAAGYISASEEKGFGTIAWRGLFFLSVSTAFFAAFLDKLGLFIATTITVYLACQANRNITHLNALFVGVGVALFCIIIFHYLVALPIPIIGEWIIGG
jgi:hypothetical protein